MQGVTWLLIAVLIIIFFFLSVQIAGLFFIRRKKKLIEQPAALPKVSLLLAARDEEALILRSLEHISQLDYPADKLQVLIGDDASTDLTAELVRVFIANRPNFYLLTITENMGLARGKANVLAHLARQATGDFLFITDVDVALPAGWIKGMLQAFTSETGIVSGTTMCEANGGFSTLQAIDWLHFMGYIKAFANVGVSCTSVGNNMAVRKAAYQQTGGYENMAFSITEDYRLFKEVTRNGWGWANLLNADTLGKATAIENVLEMLHQRKRWLIGANELPANWKILIGLYGLFIPALFVLLCIHPVWGLAVWLVKFVLQSVFINQLALKAGQKVFNLKRLFTYELYVLANTLATMLFYLAPVKPVWKRRTYSGSDLQ